MVMFAAGIVIGLLGMHIMSAGHGSTPSTMVAGAGHGHASVSHASVSDASVSHASVMGEQAVGEVGCTDCGSSDGHQALMLVCVLGLLATMLLFRRPAFRLLHVRGPRAPAWGLSSAVPSVPRPPSLDELSISRT